MHVMSYALWHHCTFCMHAGNWNDSTVFMSVGFPEMAREVC